MYPPGHTKSEQSLLCSDFFFFLKNLTARSSFLFRKSNARIAQALASACFLHRFACCHLLWVLQRIADGRSNLKNVYRDQKDLG
ncbi:hypothetical protein HMPREF3293_00837 [Christensenella minuta]|jgi:hypothetical protein|uniref:Uncharacterized protein n=1 Tax=Christensenella minuta TaxID=626937 RepID=A0A136Q606_9FIRM|nr:hypothetical protein HMPREF3293_00837 [Christensenella minuta]